MHTWHDDNIQSMHRTDTLTTQLNHLASWAWWLSVRLQTEWLWVQISLMSVKLQIWRLFRARSEFINIQATIECRFTLKRVSDMIITYGQMHRTDKFSQHSSIIWPVWINKWVFVYNLSGCGFKSRCYNISFWMF